MSEKIEGHIICHTHWDREWFAPVQVTNRWLLKLFSNLEKVIENAETEFVYVLDGQTLIVEDFLKTCKDADLNKRIMELVANGKLILGPLYAQIDFRISSELTILKNLELGQKDMQSYHAPNEDVVAWMVDNFGFVGQIPQLLKMFDVEYATIWRGVSDLNQRPAFENIWEGSDGTKCKVLFLIGGYRNLYNLSSTRKAARERYELEIEKSKSFSNSGKIPLLDGYDLDVHPENPKKFLKGKDVVLSSPSKLLSQIDFSNANVLHGELISGKYACTFPGTLSTRVYLKQQAYYTEKLLKVVQFLDSVLGVDNSEPLWRTYIKNMIHDNICGVGIDYVHSSMERSFKNLSNMARDMIRENLVAIMDSLNLPVGIYALSLSNFSYNTWCSNGKYCFKLISDGVGISSVESLYTISNVDGKWQEGDLEGKAFWENNFYTATYFQDKFRVWPRNAQNSETNFEVGGLNLFEETGDTYTTSRRAIDFETKITHLKIQYIDEHNMTISLHRQIQDATRSENSRVSIETVETIVFDETPVIKWKIKTKSKGTNYVLSFRGVTHQQKGNVFAKMPFEIVRRERKNQNLFGEDLPQELKSMLLAAREIGENRVFPFQGFVGIESSDGIFSLFSRALREYSVDGGGDIEITLIRSVEWIAKDNVQGRSGDAGPFMYVPQASCDNMDLEFDIGIYVNGQSEQSRVEELYKWFTLFDEPPILFRYTKSESSESDVSNESITSEKKDISVKMIEVDTPWLPFSRDMVITYNPFNFSYGGLQPFEIARKELQDVICIDVERIHSQKDMSNARNTSISFIEVPQFRFSKRFPVDEKKKADISNSLKQLSAEIEEEIKKEKENLETSKHQGQVLNGLQCDYIRSMHKLLTLQRKLLEIEISKLLLPKKPVQMRGILREFNNARAKRRVYDYLLEICNWMKSKSCVK